MNYKIIMFLLCAFAITTSSFGMYDKSSQPKSKNTFQIKEKKKVNPGVELLKGLAALPVIAFFSSAIMYNKTLSEELSKKIYFDQNQAFSLKTLPSIIMNALSTPIVPILGLSNESMLKQHQATNYANIAISTTGAVLLGTYTITKFYNAFQNITQNDNQ